MSPSAALGRGLVAGTLVLTPLLFHVGLLSVFEFPKVMLLRAVAIVLSALGLVSCRLRLSLGEIAKPQAATATLWDLSALGCILFVLSAVVSTATSISPLTSLRGQPDNPAGLLTVLSYAVFFFAVRCLCRDGADARRWLAGLVLAGTLAASYALVQYVGLDPLTWSAVSQVGASVRPFGTVGHANMLAAFLVIVLPLAVYLATRAWRQGRRAASAVIAAGSAIITAAILVALSRAAYLGLAALVLVSLATVMVTTRRRLRVALLALATLALPLALLVACRQHPLLAPLWQRLTSLGQDEARQEIWQAALALFQEKPWCGWGLDTFGLTFGTHRSVYFANLEWYNTPTHAHNEVLQVLATQGLLGLLAVLVLLAGLAQSAVRAWRRRGCLDRGLVTALLAASMGFLVPHLFGFTLVPSGIAFVTVAALLCRCAMLDEGVASPEYGCRLRLSILPTAKPQAAHANHLRWLAQGTVWLTAAWLLFQGVVAPWRASLLCCRGERQMAENPAAGLELLRRAVVLDGGQDVCWTRLGGAAWQAAGATSQPQESLLLESRAAFERACALVPASAYHHDNRGRILGQLARSGQCSIGSAYDAFETAIALDVHNAAFYVDAANAALGVGDWHTATVYAQRLLQDYPDFGPPLAQLGFVALEQGRPAEAEVLLRRALAQQQWPGHEPEMAAAFANLAAARLQQNDPRQAVLHAREALRRAPQMVEVRSLLAQAQRAVELIGPIGPMGPMGPMSPPAKSGG